MAMSFFNPIYLENAVRAAEPRRMGAVAWRGICVGGLHALGGWLAVIRGSAGCGSARRGIHDLPDRLGISPRG